MNRRSMLANLDTVLKMVRGEQADAAVGQGDLFGSAPSQAMKLVELDEFTDAEKLWYERKYLGTFVTGHPVLAYKHKYESKITHRMRDISYLPYTDWPGMQSVVVCGLIDHIYENRFNVSVKLSDETGTAEIQFYRDDAERARWVLRKDFIIAVKAKVRRDGSWSGVSGQRAHKVGEFTQPTR